MQYWKGIPNQNLFKIEPIGRDFKSFNDVMTDSQSEKPVTITGPMGDCYHFFLDAISSWLMKADDSEQALVDRAKAMWVTISDKLQVVALHLSIGENEYAIFESVKCPW